MLIHIGPSPAMLRAAALWGVAGLLVIFVVVTGQLGLSLTDRILR